MKLLTIIVLLLTLAPLSLSCSGGDDDTSSTSASAAASATATAGATEPSPATGDATASSGYALEPDTYEESCDTSNCQMTIRCYDFELNATGVRLKLSIENTSEDLPITIDPASFILTTRLFLLTEDEANAWEQASQAANFSPRAYFSQPDRATNLPLTLDEPTSGSNSFPVAAPGGTFNGTLETNAPIQDDTFAILVYIGPLLQGATGRWEFTSGGGPASQGFSYLKVVSK